MLLRQVRFGIATLMAMTVSACVFFPKPGIEGLEADGVVQELQLKGTLKELAGCAVKSIEAKDWGMWLVPLSVDRVLESPDGKEIELIQRYKGAEGHLFWRVLLSETAAGPKARIAALSDEAVKGLAGILTACSLPNP